MKEPVSGAIRERSGSTLSKSGGGLITSFKGKISELVP